MDTRIRVAVAGQGRSGYGIHVKYLRKVPDQYQIVAVADELPGRCDESAAEFGARAYTSWEPMLAAGGFDLFVNALPTPLHVPATVAALEAGHHVLCEKPLAATAAEIDQMAAAAKKAGRVLMPFQNNRFQPFFYKIQEIIDSGVLGKLVYVRSVWGGFKRRWDWQTLQKNHGGSLYNTGPHAIDQALCLFGFDQKPEVFCRMDNNNPFGGDAEDHCSVTLYDPERKRPQIEVTLTAYAAYPQGQMYNIGGAYGGLTGNSTSLTWRYFDPKKAPEHEMWGWSVDRQYPNETLDWIEESWEHIPEADAPTSGYTLRSFQTGPARIYTNLLGVISGSEEQVVSLGQVRRQIEVIEECHRQNPIPRNG